MNICIKMKNKFETINATPHQISNLLTANMLGGTFVKLGENHYNISMIEYWYKQKNNHKGDNTND